MTGCPKRARWGREDSQIYFLAEEFFFREVFGGASGLVFEESEAPRDSEQPPPEQLYRGSQKRILKLVGLPGTKQNSQSEFSHNLSVLSDFRHGETPVSPTLFPFDSLRKKIK